jgi:prolyl-tRNA editing enzyme YbaK/EbsC (Cys-tRNA(Pro) deacylase)
VRLDNKKYISRFDVKTKMLDAAKFEASTGHRLVGACLLGLLDAAPVYCDRSLKALMRPFRQEARSAQLFASVHYEWRNR